MPATPHSPRDRTTVRRALTAGGAVWAASVVVWALLGVAGGPGLEHIPMYVALGAPFAGIAAALWLWLATLLDVLAGDRPSRRRWLWAAGLTVVTAFVLPVMLSVAFGA